MLVTIVMVAAFAAQPVQADLVVSNRFGGVLYTRTYGTYEACERARVAVMRQTGPRPIVPGATFLVKDPNAPNAICIPH